ncbi:MAG: hypothetical protein OSJ61_02680 [Lachnospiraceae bacterium]|nr:hypothetical protein [Lachnospiraceae bacterium]
MSTSNKVTFIVGIIGAIATVSAAFISSNYAEQKIMKNLQNSIGEVSGSNNTITLNDVNDFVKDYEQVKISNERYAEQLNETSNELKELKNQMGDTPVFKFKNLGLTIEGKNAAIDSNKAFVSIDGRDYIDKTFIEEIIGDKKTFTIKDENAYIGKVIQEQANLADNWVVDSSSVDTPDTITDSYGNELIDAYEFKYRDSKIIFNVNKDYSLLQCKLSINSDANIEGKASITIKADDKIVYTSPMMDKKSKPFIKKDIPINKCSLLTIECYSNDYDISCIVSDAIVYN